MNKWINIILVSLLLTAVVSSIAIVCGVIIKHQSQKTPSTHPFALH